MCLNIFWSILDVVILWSDICRDFETREWMKEGEHKNSARRSRKAICDARNVGLSCKTSQWDKKRDSRVDCDLFPFAWWWLVHWRHEKEEGRRLCSLSTGDQLCAVLNRWNSLDTTVKSLQQVRDEIGSNDSTNEEEDGTLQPTVNTHPYV